MKAVGANGPTAVFLLDVLAFLLMGLQARSIVASLPPEELRSAG